MPQHHKYSLEEIEAQKRFRRTVPPYSADQLDDACKLGCSDPRCTIAPEDHDEMLIFSACHPEELNSVHAFYDRVTKEVCFCCAVCGNGFMKVKVT